MDRGAPFGAGRGGKILLSMVLRQPCSLGIQGHACVLSRTQLSTPLTAACQVPLSMGLFQKNTGVGCHSLLQGIFLTQGSNPCLLCLLHYRWMLYPLRHQGSPPSPWLPPKRHLQSGSWLWTASMGMTHYRWPTPCKSLALGELVGAHGLALVSHGVALRLLM